MSGSDSILPSMRIFAGVILNAWRKRCEKNESLMKELNMLKQRSINAGEQIHFYETLLQKEQEKREKLTTQLASSENIQLSLSSPKRDKAQPTSAQLEAKEQVLEGLNTLILQVESHLLQSKARQRKLKDELADDQLKVQLLEQRLKEVAIKSDAAYLHQKENALQGNLNEEEEALQRDLRRIEELELVQSLLKEKTQIVDGYLETIESLQEEINELEDDLKRHSDSTLCAHMKTHLKAHLKSSLTYQNIALQLLRCAAFCVLH